MPRKYETLWKQLKANNKAAVVAVPAYHKRIIKAVIKEKNVDTGFKLLNSHEGRVAILKYDTEFSRIRFFLIFRDDIGLEHL